MVFILVRARLLSARGVLFLCPRMVQVVLVQYVYGIVSGTVRCGMTIWKNSGI